MTKRGRPKMLLNTHAAAARLGVSPSQIKRGMKNGIITPSIPARIGPKGGCGPGGGPKFTLKDLAGVNREALVCERRAKQLDRCQKARTLVARAIGAPAPENQLGGTLKHGGVAIDVRSSGIRENALGKRLIFQTRRGNTHLGFEEMESDVLVCVGFVGHRNHFFVYPTEDVKPMVGIGIAVREGSPRWERRLTARELPGAIRATAGLRDFARTP